MELKYIFVTLNTTIEESFNRTFMELKYRMLKIDSDVDLF